MIYEISKITPIICKMYFWQIISQEQKVFDKDLTFDKIFI